MPEDLFTPCPIVRERTAGALKSDGSNYRLLLILPIVTRRFYPRLVTECTLVTFIFVFERFIVTHFLFHSPMSELIQVVLIVNTVDE